MSTNFPASGTLILFPPFLSGPETKDNTSWLYVVISYDFGLISRQILLPNLQLYRNTSICHRTLRIRQVHRTSSSCALVLRRSLILDTLWVQDMNMETYGLTTEKMMMGTICLELTSTITFGMMMTMTISPRISEHER